MARGLVVVDTDLVVDFLRGRGGGSTLVRHLVREDRLRLTAVTAFELRMGTDFLDRAETLSQLLASRTLPLDLPAALEAGRIGGELRARGVGIGAPDTLIAGVCVRHGLPLATRNVRHFARVADLDLLDIDT